MSDSNSFYASRASKKRGSLDTGSRQPERKLRANQPKDYKKDYAGLTIDLNSHKNSTMLSVNRNYTHRVEAHESSNLCELREQVEQLRMENESLREEIKLVRGSEIELKYQLGKVQKELAAEKQNARQFQEQYIQMQDKLTLYSEKIKQLFESLIAQKKKNSGLEPDVRIVLSPSNNSVNNSLNLRKHEKEGERDYYRSANKNYRAQENRDEAKPRNFHKYGREGWSIESSEPSPGRLNGMGFPDTFATRH